MNTLEWSQLRVSYSGTAGHWHGALFAGWRPVWVCSHTHHYREPGALAVGTTAIDCATIMDALVTDPERAAGARADRMAPGAVLTHDERALLGLELRLLPEAATFRAGGKRVS